jgi:hypothetical protein
MRTSPQNPPALSLAAVIAVFALSGCGTRDVVKQEHFRADTPFSARVKGDGEEVCWSVKRAFLTQGYMLDRGADMMIMTGTKDTQPDEDTQISLRLQATCVDNRDGTSTVFASAAQETHKMQKVSYSTTTGVSIATISLPSGSDKSLRLQKRETIQDPKFYQSFYGLVQKFADEERKVSRSR